VQDRGPVEAREAGISENFASAHGRLFQWILAPNTPLGVRTVSGIVINTA
jgi:hypothetical protein